MERSGKLEHVCGGLVAISILVPLLAGCESTDLQMADGAPHASPVKATYLTVRVHRGDTLSEIAARYNVSAATLSRLNGLSDRSAIFAGEELRVPADLRATREAVLRESSRPRYAAWNAPSLATKPVIVRNAPPVHWRSRDTAPRSAPREIVASSANLRSGDFVWPIEGRVILPFGSSDDGVKNDGINIAARLGAPVRAAADGTVIYAGNELKGYGNLVLVKHDNGYTTAYAHAESILVIRGDHVTKGQTIAYAGETGGVREPQVHFEIRQGVKPVDPQRFLLASRES